MMSYLLPLMCIGQMAMHMPAALNAEDMLPPMHLEKFSLWVANDHPTTECEINKFCYRWTSGFT